MSAGDWKELYSAAVNGDIELLRYHLDQGVDPNYQHPEILCTPLVSAILAGHTDVAAVLLNQGADPYLRSIYDHLTPLEAAHKMKDKVLLYRLEKMGVQSSLFQKVRGFGRKLVS